ncbi:biosurfactant protein 1 [Halostagnicola kamekurae]|uniref:DUF7995 domain-containing protein n=1 Tax=Halostagnicola kamekurae TaxID=619731 RepID=A0A1I6V694_9EURY|nr:hypothetical protein [Halostagnicola kamekurae]SFT09134.1 hypothetical protein SAMN04488556_0080 [Halostagnicola kamekurae]
MTDHYTDYEALRPLGEATYVPDERLSSRRDEGTRCQRVDGVDTDGYPDTTAATTSECSCGTSIPPGQSKCRFCLTNHLEATSDDQNTVDVESDLLHMIFALVEASTFYGAVAKGSAAATLLANANSDPAIDECQMIYDLETAPATQLADQWSSLPSAIQVTSESGTQLLSTARERTVWGASHHGDEHATYFYDESGSPIWTDDDLVTILEDANDDVWLVPAMALRRSDSESSTSDNRCERPNRTHLECRACSCETQHRFLKFEEVLDDEWDGQSFWECQRCKAPRYGPEPGGSR